MEKINLDLNYKGSLVSWCAGLFDADGCFSSCFVNHPARKRYPYLCFSATVEIREEAVVDLFIKLFGGTKIFKRARKATHSDTFCWRVSRVAAVSFIETILPFLILKKKQAEVIIQMSKVRPFKTRPITGAEYLKLVILKDKLSGLNRTGVGKKLSIEDLF